ncbi:MAG: hypothetical protein M3Y67_04805 [Pseudomonadota bacterium]|nr:hypothetical protein [Pseudomonadota bacterium]
MQVPKLIYKLLPAVYIASGVACLLTLQLNVASVVSAVLLISAGVLTAFWRKRHGWRDI